MGIMGKSIHQYISEYHTIRHYLSNAQYHHQNHPQHLSHHHLRKWLAHGNVGNGNVGGMGGWAMPAIGSPIDSHWGCRAGALGG